MVLATCSPIQDFSRQKRHDSTLGLFWPHGEYLARAREGAYLTGARCEKEIEYSVRVDAERRLGRERKAVLPDNLHLPLQFVYVICTRVCANARQKRS